MGRELKKVWEESVVSRLVEGLEQKSYQRRPYFPDLLNQPDLLMAPDMGKLIAVFVYEYSVSWSLVLASLEDLFETKLYVGEHTAVVGLLSPENGSAHRDGLQLLGNTFDSFHVLDQGQVPSTGLASALRRAVPKSVLGEFLSYEREQIRICLKRFREPQYRAVVEKDHGSEYEGRSLDERVSQKLREVLGVQELIREPLIHNVKGYLANLQRDYSFQFDFAIPGHPDRAIEVVRAGRFGSRERIRQLMTKGRLLRYEIADNRLRPKRRDFRPILIVDGNLAGPDHDPYRYVRALVSVGWEILRLDQLNELPGMIGNADFQG